MRKNKSIGKKHYSYQDTASKYLKEKLLHEAKLVLDRDYPGSGKKRNALNKQKSLLLSKIEDSIDSILYLIEESKRSESRSNSYKLLHQKMKSKKEYKREKDFFEQKICDEFQGISTRVFTQERVKRMMQSMFPTPPYPEKLDLSDRIREVSIANILLIAAMSVLRKNLDTKYYQFLSEYLDKAQDLARTIESTLRGPLKSDIIIK